MKILFCLLLLLPFNFDLCNAQSFKGKKANKAINTCIGIKNKPVHVGLGVRVGDPVGITAKVYFPQNLAFEIVAGSALNGLYANYHAENFNTYTSNENYSYVGHTVNYIYAGQARLLWHIPLPHRLPGMSVYGGAGVQMRQTSLTYLQREKRTAGYDAGLLREVDYVYNMYRPEVSLGCEHIMERVPISVFAEINYLFDLEKEYYDTNFTGGLGLRYIF